MVFATSALDDYDIHDPHGAFGGFHRGFDLAKGAKTIELDDERGGEALALHPSGTLASPSSSRRRAHDLIYLPNPCTLGHQLALATTRMISEIQGFDFELSLYDVARSNRHATASIPLRGWPAWPVMINGEPHYHQPRVNSLAYSPDGIYLAVARSDNRTEVFDARFLKNGPVHDLRHADPPAGTGSDGLYGVYKAEWLPDLHDRVQLLTSGADGAYDGSCID